MHNNDIEVSTMAGKNAAEDVNAEANPGFLKRNFQKVAKVYRWTMFTAKWSAAIAIGVGIGLYQHDPETFTAKAREYLLPDPATEEDDADKDLAADAAPYKYPDHPRGTLMAMEVPAYVDEHLKSAHESTGMEYPLLRVTAAQESGFKPTVRAKTSSACGLMQLLKGTQIALMKAHGRKYGYDNLVTLIENGAINRNESTMQNVIDICKDGLFSARMGAEYAKANIREIKEDFPGRLVNYTDIYLYHFLGAGGGRQFISKLESTPNEDAAPHFRTAADANKPTFYKDSGRGEARSFAEIYNYYAKRISTRIIEEDIPKPEVLPNPEDLPRHEYFDHIFHNIKPNPL
jgi:hypothetical protein